MARALKGFTNVVLSGHKGPALLEPYVLDARRCISYPPPIGCIERASAVVYSGLSDTLAAGRDSSSHVASSRAGSPGSGYVGRYRTRTDHKT